MTIDAAMGVREADLPWVDIGVRPGYNQRYQGFFDKKRHIGARLGSLYAEPLYHSPRHRHTFQQVRFVLSGKMRYDREEYGVGDCLYLPEGVHYGPIKPLETADNQQLHFADIQFEGPSGIPYPDPDEVVQAQRKLAEICKFEDGVYTFPTGRKRDAYEAILEQVTGTPVTYPKGRLNNYVVMRSSGYPWLGHKSFQGLETKHLAYFFESGPNIKMAKIGTGASLPQGRPIGHRAVFLLSGLVDFGGKTFDGLSYFLLPSGEEHPAFVAKDTSELLVVAWSSQGETVPFELW
jgi:hypothetical protein